VKWLETVVSVRYASQQMLLFISFMVINTIVTVVNVTVDSPPSVSEIIETFVNSQYFISMACDMICSK
jgi:hypothetical protein